MFRKKRADFQITGRRQGGESRGLTLFEVVIAIAIISLLAIIVVPNFLQAQVRAQVSQVRADLVLIATAVMVYDNDYKCLPLDSDDTELPNTVPTVQTQWYGMLTTPVMYLESVPHDPFHKNKVVEGINTESLFPGKGPYPYLYYTLGGFHADPFNADIPPHGGSPQSYHLVSIGPNHRLELFRRTDILDVYDATNGSISHGDIVFQGH